MMMMMSRFCIVCFFLIILPAYVILGSLNTVSTMVELCNNRSINCHFALKLAVKNKYIALYVTALEILLA